MVKNSVLAGSLCAMAFVLVSAPLFAAPTATDANLSDMLSNSIAINSKLRAAATEVVLGSNPPIRIQFPKEQDGAANGGCSQLTAADVAQIERLSLVRVSAEARVVPLRYGTSESFIVPATCKIIYGVPDSALYSVKGSFFSHGNSCTTAWACADAASLLLAETLAERAQSPIATWFSDRLENAEHGIGHFFRGNPALVRLLEGVALVFAVLLLIAVGVGGLSVLTGHGWRL